VSQAAAGPAQPAFLLCAAALRAAVLRVKQARSAVARPQNTQTDTIVPDTNYYKPTVL